MSQTNTNQPLYAQIADDLLNHIKTKKWQPGQRIPTEMTLCETYHVSRITIRKAIDELVVNNLLIRKRAKGTFVNHFALDKPTNYTLVKGLTQELLEQGKLVTSVSVTLQKKTADHEIAKYLNLDPGSPIIVLSRIRGIDTETVAYFKTYLPFDARFSLDAADYYGSLYEYLKQFDLQFVKKSEYVEAITANRTLQNLLRVNKNEAILKRVIFTQAVSQSFLEYTECYYIGRKYKYYLDFSTK